MKKRSGQEQEVRELYEDYPYPFRDPDDERKGLSETLLDGLDKINHYCFGGKKDFSEGFRALIAGGGTGDAVIYLAEQLRQTDAEIVYMDISESSMNIAKKRAEVRGLENVTWLRESLLNVPELGLGKFDFINCSGVLHHLADPDEGLRALTSVLKEEGAMGIMVYAQYGRTAIYQMQELMRRINQNENNRQEKVENCKIVLQNLPDSNWFKLSGGLNIIDITQYGDIGIYDLLLHPQDRAYTVPQLYEFVEEAGLNIVQFFGDDGRGDYKYKPETYINDKELLTLIAGFDLREKQAIAELLCGDIQRHVFYAARTVQPVPSIEDLDNIPSLALRFNSSAYKELYSASMRDKDVLTLQEGATGLNIHIRKTPNTSKILKFMDGKKSLKQIFRKVIDSHASMKKRPNYQQLVGEFQNIFDELSVPNWIFLRSNSVPQYRTAEELQSQFTNRRT